MTVATAAAWTESNQRYLGAALRVVRERLAGGDSGDAHRELDESARTLQAPPAIDRVRDTFGLSTFERDVLLLCAGVELDPGFAAAVYSANDGRRPTFGFALDRLPDAHWSALTPTAPLRWWRLVELEAGELVSTGTLRIDERILHYLAGAPDFDTRLAGVVEPVHQPVDLPPTQAAVAARVATLAQSLDAPLALLCGGDAAGRRAVAAAGLAGVGLCLYAQRAADVPAAAEERELLSRLWTREALLERRALLLEWDAHDGPETSRAALALADRTGGVVVLAGPEPLRPRGRPILRLDVSKPTLAEQLELWRDALDGTAHNAAQLAGIVAHFDLDAQSIRAIAADVPDGLWEACRSHARPHLDGLAQRIRPSAGWDDLVLSAAQRQLLAQLASQVRLRGRVHDAWGFAAKSERGLGISALFAGPSGTGKTMAAEVLAGELELDLYRIDLSAVVSKYIGETEKNLRRIFDAAEEGGAVLLFDEADALFGKRTEVRDSHDRYANVEVSYLLQRMEAYRGLAILTTNMKGALDAAFLRRLRFVVEFPFPDAERRADIWSRIFPPETPVAELDPARLARLSVAGGNIRNIAIGAAFLAADADVPVSMSHLERAARVELAKLERPATEAEIGGWA